MMICLIGCCLNYLERKGYELPPKIVNGIAYVMAGVIDFLSAFLIGLAIR